MASRIGNSSTIALAALWVLFGCCLGGFSAAAQELSVHASVSHQKVPQGGRLEFRVAVEGSQHAPAPQLSFEGFDTYYLGPSTQISIVNGRMSSSVTHTYVLTALKEGVFTLGPVSIEVDGKTLNAEPVEIAVGPPSSASQRVQLPGADASQMGDALQLTIAMDSSKAYVNQEVPLKIQFLIGGVPLRGVEMPKLEAEGVIVRPIREPVQSQVMVGASPYTLLEFPLTIVPIRSGSLMLGPATINGEILKRDSSSGRARGGQGSFGRYFDDDFFDSFFARTVRVPVAVRAEPVSLEVLPLPSENQPEGFSGAVGRFSIQVEALPKAVQMGDPVTLTMTIRGEGNQESIGPPQLTGDLKRFKIYDPQPLPEREGSSAKAFEQVLIPMDAEIKALPRVRFSYFDPALKRYETREIAPIPIEVSPAAKASGPAIEGPTQAREVLGRDIIYIKSDPGDWQAVREKWPQGSGFWIWLGFPVLAIGISEIFRKKQERLIRDPAAARASSALKSAVAQFQEARRLARSGKAQEGYAAIYRAVQRYVGDRLNLPSESLTRIELEQALGARRAPTDVVRALAHVADRCDAARFAPGSGAEAIEETISAAENNLRRLERWRPA